MSSYKNRSQAVSILFLSLFIALSACAKKSAENSSNHSNTVVSTQATDLSDLKVIQLQSAVMNGSGCDSFQVDSSALKNGVVRLHDFIHSNQIDTRVSNSSRNNCSVSIPFSLSNNQRLVISKLRSVASIQLQEGLSAQSSSEWFFAGSVGSKNTITQTGLFANTYAEQTLEAISKSECGVNGSLRLNQSQLLSSSGDAPNSIGSIDTKSSEVTLAIESCN